MTGFRSFSFTHPVATVVTASLLLAGCSGSSRTSVQFVESATARTPGLVKLVGRSVSDTRVVVDVLVYGPEPDLDLNAFQFGIKIDDPAFLRFAPQADYRQTALVAGEGQTIEVDVDGVSDPSLIAVSAVKRGGGDGNGLESATAIVVELEFEIQGEGGTSLTLVGVDGDPPRAFDSTRAPIEAVSFDTLSAGVVGVTVSDGGY